SIGGPSFLRPAWGWMSIRPRATILPPASIVSVAAPAVFGPTGAVFPAATATARTASSPTQGASPRPPLMGGPCGPRNAPGARASIAAAAAEVQRNWRRLIMVVSSLTFYERDAPASWHASMARHHAPGDRPPLVDFARHEARELVRAHGVRLDGVAVEP